MLYSNWVMFIYFDMFDWLNSYRPHSVRMLSILQNLFIYIHAWFIHKTIIEWVIIDGIYWKFQFDIRTSTCVWINLADHFMTNFMAISADRFWNYIDSEYYCLEFEENQCSNKIKIKVNHWKWMIRSEPCPSTIFDQMVEFYSLIFAMTNPFAYIRRYI